MTSYSFSILFISIASGNVFAFSQLLNFETEIFSFLAAVSWFQFFETLSIFNVILVIPPPPFYLFLIPLICYNVGRKEVNVMDPLKINIKFDGDFRQVVLKLANTFEPSELPQLDSFSNLQELTEELSISISQDFAHQLQPLIAQRIDELIQKQLP
ncbi:hypothetical protein Spy49_1525 [Streptococcus phage NZ131.3]|nr:hypothetical protein Spy49_1525 [Streptococcus pyogenes NZ131]